MAMANQKPIDLGFAEQCDPTFLRNVYFPSKIGGKPAWLDLDSIPLTQELNCKKCDAPKSFLCQIYAPIEDNPDCFHRMIFLFICREASCFVPNSAENICAFRSQLPRQNKFYSAVPPDEEEKLDPVEPTCKICKVCGCRGALMCSRCKNINYCSVKHQRAHWPQHKVICQSTKLAATGEVNVPLVMFPEFEIIIEHESLESDGSERSDDEEAEKRRLNDFQKLVDQGKTGTLGDIPESELKKYATDDDTDVSFRKFKKTISANPEQVLRYDLSGQPLWIADVENTIGSVEVPPCPGCNSERQFEFQIMPQMINYLEDDNIDWGVLAVYTCKTSCKGIGGYASEFIIKQDIQQDNNK